VKVLCCGDREWKNWKVIKKTLASLGPNTIIVEGEARGRRQDVPVRGRGTAGL
jgi:hypothetical protein